MRLYDYILSPSCYKVRLMASLVGVKLDLRPVDFHPGAEHRGLALLALNPAGSIPILEDGDLVLTESSAMLAYLAVKAAPAWLGSGEAVETARIQQWLAFSARLTASLGGARLVEMLLRPGDIGALQASGIAALRQLEAGLFERLSPAHGLARQPCRRSGAGEPRQFQLGLCRRRQHIRLSCRR